nr:hypothetical protein CTI12_AA536880 [Tanacetum cinerariifolium]
MSNRNGSYYSFSSLAISLQMVIVNHDDQDSPTNFSFISSFQNNLLHRGLHNQVGWGHVWNRFAGQLSCHSQPNQCALTPLLPPGWWDGLWQSPIPRDIRRMEAYGVKLSGFGTIDDNVDVRITFRSFRHHSWSLRAVTAVLNCIKTNIARLPKDVVRPRVVLISDTPSLISDLLPKLLGFTEVLHFEYKKFKGNISGSAQDLGFRVKDWGPAPRWVAFVDFFLASRATHAVITGAQRRVGTTYAQLIAALAAAHQLGKLCQDSLNLFIPKTLFFI